MAPLPGDICCLIIEAVVLGPLLPAQWPDRNRDICCLIRGKEWCWHRCSFFRSCWNVCCLINEAGRKLLPWDICCLIGGWGWIWIRGSFIRSCLKKGGRQGHRLKGRGSLH